MHEWEYREVDLNDLPRKTEDIDLLNTAGNERWEVVAIMPNNIAYLKRQIENRRQRLRVLLREPRCRKREGALHRSAIKTRAARQDPWCTLCEYNEACSITPLSSLFDCVLTAIS
jgi:hypothetical protein